MSELYIFYPAPVWGFFINIFNTLIKNLNGHIIIFFSLQSKLYIQFDLYRLKIQNKNPRQNIKSTTKEL